MLIIGQSRSPFQSSGCSPRGAGSASAQRIGSHCGVSKKELAFPGTNISVQTLDQSCQEDRYISRTHCGAGSLRKALGRIQVGLRKVGVNMPGQSFVALAPAESIATVHVTRVKGASQTHPKQSIKHPPPRGRTPSTSVWSVREPYPTPTDARPGFNCQFATVGGGVVKFFSVANRYIRLAQQRGE